MALTKTPIELSSTPSIVDGGNATAITIDSSENVGIGTSSPGTGLDCATTNYTFSGTTYDIYGLFGDTSGGIRLGADSSNDDSVIGTTGTNNLQFVTYNGSAWGSRMTLDNTGNVLVGKTVLDNSTVGIRMNATGDASFVADGSRPLVLNRKTSDGDIALFLKDGTTVGSVNSSDGDLAIGTGDCGIRFNDASNAVIPFNITTNAQVDNTLDLGYPTLRWNDAYITNGVTTGSDRNQKQDIEALSDAEQRVAVACKGLLRKWRWIDAVEAKGDNARIHFGIIAQDLQAAFEAEGLDAGRYAMFMSNTWWETQTEVAAVEAVEATEDTEAIEAVDAYTRTDTYDTAEEAPEGATERTRLGVRYSELLAFIIAAI